MLKPTLTLLLLVAGLLSHPAFVGQVRSVKPTEPFDLVTPSGEHITGFDSVEVTLDVSRTWKGKLPRRTTIYTSTTTCGREFLSGTQYLVFAKRHPQRSRLEDGLCSRTRLADDASDDIKILGGSDASHD